MCEQTEINYLDGDVVWVKLGPCWWPGQVIGLHNLPDDVQTDFRKKPLIAAVKFFQEDSYEFVKNYQQIYKYNCTLKDEFIKKGLDKYRSKSKVGTSYMDKFPGDIEMAEKLTGGDADILNRDKFCPPEKPDISGLFGEKKTPKKKRDRGDGHKRNDSSESLKRYSLSRFSREGDHEVRIRHQPNDSFSTPIIPDSPQYPCHLCNFTSSRVNVTICHIKSHKPGDSPIPRSKIKTYSSSHSRISDASTPKRKYVRKEKSQSNKKKSEVKLVQNKRKQTKQNEKVNKKKKTDPELREKLLADWEDESDEETDFNINNSFNSSCSRNSPAKNQSSVDDSKGYNEENYAITDSNEIIAETEKLLKETEDLSSIHIRDSLHSPNTTKNLRCSTSNKKFDSEKNVRSSALSESRNKSQRQGSSKSNIKTDIVSDKDDKKSRLSCFDFDEDDLSEPSMPPVRKIPRVFGEKNLSLKKEIIKEFEMSQALENEVKKEIDKVPERDKNVKLKTDEIMEIIQGSNALSEAKETKVNEKLNEAKQDKTEIKQVEDEVGKKIVPLKSRQQKSDTKISEAKLEIVESFEGEKEKGDNDRGHSSNIIHDTKKVSKAVTNVSIKTDEVLEKKKEISIDVKTSGKIAQSRKTDSESLSMESKENFSVKETDDNLSERFTTETEDETVSESAETMPEQSEASDIDMLDQERSTSDAFLGKRVGQQIIKRGRGRPRKNAGSVNKEPKVDKTPKVRTNRTSKRLRINENIEIEPKASDSDTDRSYSGRRRKPNKKYLESDIYVQDSDYKTFKTDESQSESDDKIPEKIIIKSRRGRRPKSESKTNELAVQIDKQQMETSEQILTSAENNVGILSTNTKCEGSESNLKGEKFIENFEEKSENEVKRKESVKSLDEAIIPHADMKSPSKVPKVLIKEAANKMNAVEIDLNKASEKKQDKNIEHNFKDQKKILIIQQAGDVADKVETLSSDTSKTSVDLLPPKKSQIKKFELSQIDFLDTDAQASKEIEVAFEPEVAVESKFTRQTDPARKINKVNEIEVKMAVSKIKDEKVKLVSTGNKDQVSSGRSGTDLMTEQNLEKSGKQTQLKEKILQETDENIDHAELRSPETSVSKPDRVMSTPKSAQKMGIEQRTPQRSMQTRYKGRFTPETGIKGKKDKDLFAEEKPANTFQEAFLKTLQMDKKKVTSEDAEAILGKGKKGKRIIKKKTEEDDSTTTTAVKINESNKDLQSSENIYIEGNVSDMSVISNFENVEVVVEEKLESDSKIEGNVFKITNPSRSPASEFIVTSKSPLQSPTTKNKTTSVLDIKKSDEIAKTSISTTSPSSDTSVPVKKREMPRIIEDVTITEQILKSKLLDKIPQKGVKHKLEADMSKKEEQKSSPKSKLMKIETSPSNSKVKSTKVILPHLSLTKKLQVLKAEETGTFIEAQEKQSMPTTQTLVNAPVTEKYIQQSSQNLADMDLDINSMPFVLSEDVLTPESIEQMPVVISSIIPASSSIPATLSFTTTQIVSPTQTQFKITKEVTTEASSAKKKSGIPAILKNKKAKPTITNITTLVPPLTGGVKGLKFQSAQTSKGATLLPQKGTPGKYVVVQTAAGQQLHCSVQGKPGTQQKIAIPTGKTAGNAQIVQQGGKVVILTSGQSCQTKMVPLNISNTLGRKVQRIVTSKGQLLCPISPQNIITSKTIITPKIDTTNSPTTSKLATSHKIINTQGIITSKGVLTPITGTIAKTALLGTLPQGIITKGGIYTPISASALSGKTIIGSKALVTKGATLLSSQNLGNTKAILTPVSQAISGKTILTTQAIVGGKGTVLTPITGQQVKAIAAKSPSKSGKAQYQPVQQKIQLPILQKSPKVPISSVSQARASTALKSPSGTLILQNATTTSPKGMQQGKKIIKQAIIQTGTPLQSVASPSGTQQTVSMVSQMQAKGKTASASPVQKVIIPRASGRQTKTQQKIVVQRMQDSTVSTVQNIHTKQTSTTTSANMPIVTKTVGQSKQVAGVAPKSIPKSTAKSHFSNKASQAQKNLLNVALNSVNTTVTNTNVSTSLAMPSLEPIDAEKKTKTDAQLVDLNQKEQTKAEKPQVERSSDAEKVEEPKVAAQPQIMALPTESSDGTQTYVLVTIDEQGQIQPLDNNTLMSLEGTTQNPDGTRTLYIDPSSLGEAGTLDNIVLQFDNGILPNIQTAVTEPSQTIISESFPASEIIQTSNQDILAAALANTDFQQEINLPENQTSSVMTTGLTQTNLINQTILQSTIIPPTEPISSPSVLETSLTLNQPIMTPLEVPSNLPIQSESTSTSAVSTIPSSLELPITITNPNISYISTGEAQIQIPGNSMPDIGEIMENPASGEINRTEIPVSTQYLVIPNLEENLTDNQNVQNTEIAIPSASYSVSIPNNIVLENSQVQTTPSMPIIDDTYVENSQFATSIVAERTFADVPVSEMLISKAPVTVENVQSQDITVTSEMIVSSHDDPTSSQKLMLSINEPKNLEKEQTETMQKLYTPQEASISEELDLQQSITKGNHSSAMEVTQEEKNDNEKSNVQTTISSLPIISETTLVASDSSPKMSITEQVAATSNEVESLQATSQILPSESLNPSNDAAMEIGGTDESKSYVCSTLKHSEDSQRDEPSSQKGSSIHKLRENIELNFEETSAEPSQETPSQSYDQFNITITSGSADLPSQSIMKSENSDEATQSIAYEPMETDEEIAAAEPPTQSFEHSKINEASQSYDISTEMNVNAPTQSFNEIMQSQEEEPSADEAIDDQSFPTQSYEVDKGDNLAENLETDAEISQEGNIPSQSNDIGADGIGTSSMSTNNSGLNEDETASSSYVPETPENQERDQDQESAISTSSYEIPPCEELNIASSSVIPDTSARSEHINIHDNGIPEIPTSSYNLNPDITSTHVDSVPSSSYEDQVIIEQNVSTSYEVPISMPGLEETCAQNFVTESTNRRNEPSSYYAHHQEVTASYYESADQETDSRLEEDSHEEVTPSYYEGNAQEVSQSYFAPTEETSNYTPQSISPSYYDPRPESEASQSYYSTDDLGKTEEQSFSPNVETSQSFYQERSGELRLRQQGEATPAYSEGYPVDYTLDNSPIERHDLVESSVPATKPTER